MIWILITFGKQIKNNVDKNVYKAIVENGSVKIYINDILHVCVKQKNFIGFQAWREGSETREKYHVIEYYTKDKTFKTEYNEREKWISILDLLDKLKLFSNS